MFIYYNFIHYTNYLCPLSIYLYIYILFILISKMADACDSDDRSGMDVDLFTEHSTDSESLYLQSQNQSPILGDSSSELFSCGGEIDRSNVTAFDYENDGVEESPMRTDALDVACGSIKGIFRLDLFECGASKCIEYGGSLVTPSDFEKRGGKGRSKKWKHSIKLSSGDPIEGALSGVDMAGMMKKQGGSLRGSLVKSTKSMKLPNSGQSIVSKRPKNKGHGEIPARERIVSSRASVKALAESCRPKGSRIQQKANDSNEIERALEVKSTCVSDLSADESPIDSSIESVAKESTLKKQANTKHESPTQGSTTPRELRLKRCDAELEERVKKLERRLGELESCLEEQILRNIALEERLCKLENHERATGIEISNPQDPRLNPSIEGPEPAAPTEVCECVNPPVGNVSQECEKPQRIPTRSVKYESNEKKPPKVVNSTKARSSTSVCQAPSIPHSEEAEKVGAPYHKGPRRYVGKRKLWGTRFSESEESIKGKIEGVLEGKGEVLVRKIEVEDKGRVKWWFWIEADEVILRGLEEIKDKCDKYWKLESSPFLGGVRILPKIKIWKKGEIKENV